MPSFLFRQYAIFVYLKKAGPVNFTSLQRLLIIFGRDRPYYAPAPVGEAGALGGHRRPSSVRPSVCLSDVAYIGS